MKKTLLTLTIAAIAAVAVLGFAGTPAHAAAATFVVDPNHSDVSFRIRHLMSPVRGRFTKFEATVIKDDANPSASSVTFTIDSASIDTGVADRDKHLRSEDFFAVDQHPKITFKSSKVEKVSDSAYKVTGELKMRGVTKVITLDVTLDGEMKDPGGNLRVGFSTSTTLDRKEFGINWNRALDTGGFLLADEVKAEISLELKKSS